MLTFHKELYISLHTFFKGSTPSLIYALDPMYYYACCHRWILASDPSDWSGYIFVGKKNGRTARIRSRHVIDRTLCRYQACAGELIHTRRIVQVATNLYLLVQVTITSRKGDAFASRSTLVDKLQQLVIMLLTGCWVLHVVPTTWYRPATINLFPLEPVATWWTNSLVSTPLLSTW